MTPAHPSRLLGLLLRTALGPPDVAVASSRELASALDLDTISGLEYDAVCLLGSRLAALDVDIPDRARISGIARHSWAGNQSSFAAAAGSLPPIVTGRWATIIHLPSGWVLPAGLAPRPRRYPGPTVAATIAGAPVAAPTVAAHLVDVLINRQWVDAACLLPLAPPREVEAVTVSRRRGVAVGAALRSLQDILGTAAPVAMPRIQVDWAASMRERFWTSAFAAAAPLRASARRARSR